MSVVPVTFPPQPPSYVAPSLADRMRALAREKQIEDEKSDYNRVTREIEAIAKTGREEMNWPAHFTLIVKELLLADGFKLKEGFQKGKEGTCSCDFGCSSCSAYQDHSWTTISWAKS